MWLANYIRNEAQGITSKQGCTGESGFDPVELWVMGPPCGLKVEGAVTSCSVMTARNVKRVACQLCRPQHRHQGRGAKRTIFLLVEQGRPIGKVLVHRWLPECQQQ